MMRIRRAGLVLAVASHSLLFAPMGCSDSSGVGSVPDAVTELSAPSGPSGDDAAPGAGRAIETDELPATNAAESEVDIPQTVLPEPETGEPEGDTLETVEPEPAEPETVEADGDEGEVAKPEVVVADTSETEGPASDLAVPEEDASDAPDPQDAPDLPETTGEIGEPNPAAEDAVEVDGGGADVGPPAPTPPGVPVLTATEPPSPSSEASPLALGVAEPGVSIEVLLGPGCGGEPLGAGESDAEGGFSIAILVPLNQPSELVARSVGATAEGPILSECSDPLVYVHDDQPPLFWGVATAEGSGVDRLVVSWESAADNLSPASTLVYELCVEEAPAPLVTESPPPEVEGLCDPFVVAASTPSGALSWEVGGLEDFTRYAIRVRAVDEAGNADSNKVIAYGTTLSVHVAKEVVVGEEHGCALLGEGTVWCWGSGELGQLGAGELLLESSEPVQVAGLDMVKALSAGARHTCALRADGSIWCWGDDVDGQCGGLSGGVAAEPAEVPALEAMAQLAAGTRHTCARDPWGHVHCWGASDTGQLGPSGEGPGPTEVVGLELVTHVAAGGDFTCARVGDGSARCWGEGGAGQLGAESPAPGELVEVPGLDLVRELGAGAGHACIVSAWGQVWCWGANDAGQAAPGSAEPLVAPAPVTLSAPVQDIALGPEHTCALLEEGTVACWGAGYMGTPDEQAASVPDVDLVVDLAAGSTQTCALRVDGRVRCWTQPLDIDTGDIEPTDVEGLVGRVRPHQLGAAHLRTCALLTDGTARCWGHAGLGATGTGSTKDPVLPASVVGLGAAACLAAGWEFGLARVGDASLQVWGNPYLLGLDPNPEELVLGPPVPNVLVPPTLAMAAFPTTAVVHLANGETWYWGTHLGDVFKSPKIPTLELSPIPLAHSMAMRDAIAYDGQWSYYDPETESFGVLLLGPGDFVGPTRRSRMSGERLVRRADGGVWFWGGTGLAWCTSEPCNPQDCCQEVWLLHAEPIAGLAGALQTAAERHLEPHACAVMPTGDLRCWGDMDSGIAGNGVSGAPIEPQNTIDIAEDAPVADISAAVDVMNLSGAIAVDVGRSHSCALRADGSLWCWGADIAGQLGQGITDFTALEPVQVQNL